MIPLFTIGFLDISWLDLIDILLVTILLYQLYKVNTGALIVFARSSELKLYAESGDYIDAVVSKRLLISIFNKNSPLHDGAVIIAENRLKAARCILPVTESHNVPASMGLRHRAAIGLTEVTDSVVMVVSEETGQISLVRNGQVYRNLAVSDLRSRLNQFLFDIEPKAVMEKSASAA